ncbi:HET-domain-containing protein [Clathrospora elynae]|uniref:HET-domain-containing protein n=1 Tax=Clathrospora elynae TaxID=706981 RepID=A0A6A5S8M5_9PLEO|nr:HET-domain-containing protein [Clathrospora elynae]
MRLLQRQGDSSFRLVYRVDKHIPPYAILSHTWGADEDEVTFRDLTDGTGTTKAGYRKINFCAKQAALDGLQFFWIDTCCIDKFSSAELLEAINCMFRWYRDSAKCYVYLDDVSADSLAENGLAFQKSRWFTRGWTLQELLAPKCVEFFSTEGYLLGSKSSLLQEIAEITRIPTEALQERALSHFSVDQRMIWAKGRETTREEDMAYSLLGIFDIQMSLFYGEGRERAFKRLHRKIINSQEAGRSNGGEDVALRSDHFKFVLQIPTMLHETNNHFSLLMGDSNKNGPPDLIAVKRTGTSDEHIEVNVLYGASNYQKFILRIATPNFTPLRKNLTGQLDFALTDWNGDGTLDLVVIKKLYTGTNSTEVHIFSGASQFQKIVLQTGTKLEETDDTWTFGMGRWGAGDKPDLFAIKKSNTGTKTTEVHVLCGDNNFQNFILQTGTGLHETDSNFDFVVTDWNGDGRPDLVTVKKSKTSGRCTEVHVLSGASTYKEFILRSETPLFRSNGLFEFAVADWTGNGKPDLIALRKRDTGTNTTEMHVMSQQG